MIDNRQYILFSETILNSTLHISVTRSAINGLVENYLDPMDFFRRISTSNPVRMFKVSSAENGDSIRLYTRQGSLVLRPDQQSSALTAVAFYPYSVRDENDAFSRGYSVQFNGISVCVKWHERESYALYYNGEVYETREEARFKSLCNCTQDLFNLLEVEDTRPERAKLREERKELSSILDKAENYAELSSQLEQINAEKLGRINYIKFESLERNRVDRAAYRFTVDKKYEKEIKVRNTLAIHKNENDSIKGEVISVSSNNRFAFIDVLFQENTDDRDIPKKGYMSIEVNSVNLRVQKSAIDKIRDGSAKASYMFDVLGRHMPAGFSRNDLTSTEAFLKEKGKNQSQINAVKNGINSKDIYLVMGPPGTGKTTVIVECVKYFVRRNQRVLISSQNNKAVDNVIERMGEEKNLDILRIGSEANLQEGVIPFMFEKKISALRRSIDYAVTHNKKEFDEIIKQWMQYALLIKNTYLLRVEKIDSDMNNAVALAEKHISPLLIDLHDAREQIESVNRELAEVQSELGVHIERVRELQKMGPIMGAIFGLFWGKSVTAYRELEPRFKQLVEDRSELRKKYRTLYDRYEKAISNFKLMVLPQLNKEIETFRTGDYESLQDRKPAADEYGIFAEAEQYTPSLYSIESWKNYLRIIAAAIKRSESVENIIVEWRNEVNSSQNYALNDLILESVDLVGATCVGVLSQRRFSELDFDVTIIDEAGQIQIQNALVPMSVSNKVIMLGDHKQIPPIADPDLIKLCESNEVETDLLEKSLFEELYNVLPETNKTLLDTQYRMPAEIADIISEWFYDGKYKSGTKHSKEAFIPSLFRKNLVLIDTSKEKRRKDQKSPEGGYRNVLEAEVVKQLLKAICLDNEIGTEEIGVISAWNYQVATIKEAIAGVFEPEQIRGMVASLDSFQGQERNVIIYSFTKSNEKIPPEKRRIGFLNELRRLNVAISRCKKTLIMIGDFDFLTSCKHMDIDEDGNEIYEKSEAQFSDFIKLLVKRVEEGSGEHLTVKSFYRRIGEAE